MLASFLAVEHAGQESTGVSGTEAPNMPSECSLVRNDPPADRGLEVDYNVSRPHMAFGNIAPQEYALRAVT
jgi:hypothetical protein